ncbi:MAG: PorV/PorQ family protein [Candidatus Marinimicrobia bacterium]|nr:PorV/PorQ family protein [Candidatus Neomarinimicrobiota bacterium]
MNKKTINIFLTITTLILIVNILYAGDASRVGTAGATQLQVPIGGRNIGFAGADIVYTQPLDAVYWNPAGLGDLDMRASGLFSMQNLIADIKVSYFAVGVKMGTKGVLGVSVKTFDFGEILVTTEKNMDGTGATYSPNFSTVSLTYGRKFTDRINFGISGKIVSESIPRASASVTAFDAGLQYKDLLRIKGLGFGIAMKNISIRNLKYEGAGLLKKARQESESYTQYLNIPTMEAHLPASVDIGLSYLMKMGTSSLLVSGVFQQNNFQNDELRYGAEISLFDMLSIRCGYDMILYDPDNPDIGKSIYEGISYGGSLTYSIQGVNFSIDYAYRSTKYFNGNSSFCITIEL